MELLSYFGNAITPLNLALAFCGVAFGTIIGALPGLSATMAVAVLVPFTFTMDPGSGLVMLGAIYTGAIYGGAYAAILVNTPGTPSAIATTFDGFPMAKSGRGALAVTLATLSSVFGGIVGCLVLMFLAPPLATVALQFGPAEYFWLAILGLTLISALSAGNQLKGWAAALLGLLLSCVGVATVGGDIRLTQGSTALVGGVNVVAGLIGIYCIPVLIDLVLTRDPHLKAAPATRGFQLGEAMSLLLRDKLNLIRSSILGTLIGILPGAGGSIASLIAYAEARRAAPDKESFGKGNPSGVIATESANNATVGGGLVPTLVLGIPGTPPDAIILGALLVQGIKIGPSLFTEQAEVIYTFIDGLMLATLFMLPAGLLIGRYAYRSIAAIPKSALVPLIAFLTIVGSYAIQNNFYDVIIMVCLGGTAWVLGRFGYPLSPIALGLVLGSIAEQGFVQTYLIGRAQGDILGRFFSSPISIVLVGFIILGLALPLLRHVVGLSRIRLKENAQ
ncbi:MAG: tripartite tricarboxylate transporter permease [Xanthobacter sp.]